MYNQGSLVQCSIYMFREARIRKSMSIPVHLTVSKEDSVNLPYSLRPDPFCDEDYHGTWTRQHDRDCEVTKHLQAKANCPRSMSHERTFGAGKRMTWKRTVAPYNGEFPSNKEPLKTLNG